ncbi:hypothetical protein MKX01_026525 [Papaver californicum]|nr:hypothetical protein MKX01_026525 [Papaver californicum]
MDDNPQLLATKKSRCGAKLSFLTKLKKGEKIPLEFCLCEPNICNYSDEINNWVEEKIHSKWQTNKYKIDAEALQRGKNRCTTQS